MLDQPPPPAVAPPPPPAPVPTAPVRPVRPVRSHGAGIGLRWAVAAIAVVLVASGSYAGYRLLTASQANAGATLAGLAPKNAIAYAEVHLDVPGDQHQKLAAFLAHFPGFGSASDLDSRLTDLYDRLLTRASKGTMTWSADVAPWFGGSVGIALTRLPKIAKAPPASGSVAADSGIVILVGIKDRAGALAWAQKATADIAGTPSTESYQGVDVTSVGSGAYAVTDRALLIGETATVKQTIDDGAAGGLGASKAFTDATSALTGTNLGTLFVDVSRYADWLTAQMPSGTNMLCGVADDLPGWFAASFAADSNALLGHAALPHVPGGPAIANTPSTLIGHIPASALAVIDEHELGAVVRNAVQRFEDCDADAAKGVQGGVDRLGGWDKLTGWVGETAIVLDRDGDQPTGGLLVVPKDRAAAETFAVQVKNLAALAGGPAPTESPYAGTTITTFDISGSDRQIAYAFADGYIVLGDAAWVRKVLDTTGATSLAASARFTTALGQASAEHATLVYADLAGVRSWIETELPAAQAKRYADEVQPFVAPFEALLTTTRTGTDVDRTDAVLTVK